MTGLNLEPFLRLLRADLGVWLSLGAVALVLGLMAWTSWGSRRALRKCLVLSILAHVALLLYGGGLNSSAAEHGDGRGPEERIQSITVVGEDGTSPGDPSAAGDSARPAAAWDQPGMHSGLKDEPLRVAKPTPAPMPVTVRATVDRVSAPAASPPDLASSDLAKPDAAPDSDQPPAMLTVAPARPGEIPAEDAVPVPPADRDVTDSAPIRIRPDRPVAASHGSRAPRTVLVDRPAMPAVDVPLPGPAFVEDPTVAAAPDQPAPDRGTDEGVDMAKDVAAPRSSDGTDGDLRAHARAASAGSTASGRVRMTPVPLTIARGAGSGPGSGSGNASLPLPAARPIADVPEVYRERIAPDRPARAKRMGASDASEEAVERALEWLAQHQDADGRWNAGTKKYRADDAPLAGEHNFTIHCPPGDVCAGECYYYEADTAMTGLALLAYLGAGHHHAQKDGKHAAVVEKGLRYLLSVQAADGDLRGESRAVGMYCHAMATLAVCEAFALSGDARLRGPAERAVAFLAKSRAADGMSWRYKPGEPSGDTSLLGWSILVFKSADETGLAVPPSMRTGALSWLNLVSAGESRGLAVYRPNEGPYGNVASYVAGRNMTPTMTAEAWVCRQFLGVGGPGAASDEAARYLLSNAPGRGKLNLYYWYYGTLAMRQRGGNDWARWNLLVRDELVLLQKTSGHASGSWDPADSRGPNGYDARGGRIYCTALAAMTLEVYYRYGKIEGVAPTRMAPKPDATLRRTDGRKPVR